LRNLDYLREIGRNTNRRLLAIERTTQDCAIGQRLFGRIILPTQHDNQRAPGVRFGQPRVMALMGALSGFVFAPDGITSRMLRPRMGALMDLTASEYTAAKISYDLRRLRMKGIVARLDRRNRYTLTSTGRRVALFFAKVCARLLKPGLQATYSDVPPQGSALRELAHTWRKLDHAIDQLVESAKLCA
jgi:hypothetical protein